MTENAFIEKMVDLMDTEDELTMDTNLLDIEEWDSLSFVSFIAFANAKVGKKVTSDMVRSAKTVSDLYHLIEG